MTSVQTRLPSLRFVILVVITFAVQIGLIFWLSDRRPPRTEKHRPEARISLLEEDANGLLELQNGSLFALPHVRSFSGDAWLSNAPLSYVAFDWTEAPRWLGLEFQPVDISMGQMFAATTKTPPRLAIQRSEPELAVPGMLSTELLPQRSKLRLLLGSSEFNLVDQPEMPSWAHSELVSNSVVQVAITADGKALSAALLSSCGHRPADDFALTYARSMQMSPLPEMNPKTMAGPLRWAIFSFDWHTGPAQPGGRKAE